jgi:hypothetical protein
MARKATTAAPPPADEPVALGQNANGNGRGMHPNSRAQLRARQTGSRKPTRPKARKLFLEQLRRRGWKGNPENLDFDLLAHAMYDLEYEKRSGADRSRLRNDVMTLADRLGIGARALGHNAAAHVKPNRSYEHRITVIRKLAVQGALGPEFGDAAVAMEARLEREARNRIAQLVTDEES